MGGSAVITRRRFLGAVGLGLVCRPGRGDVTTRPQGGLVSIAYNVMKCVGWPEGYAKKRLGNVVEKVPELTGQALAAYGPDLINFSEAPDKPIVRRIAERLGMKFAFFPSGEFWPGAILSRFEIIEHRNCPVVEGARPKQLFTRHWGRATLKTPFGEVVVHSAHLYPMHVKVRQEEAVEMLRVIEPDIKAGRSVLVQGDLNLPPTEANYKRFIDAGLVDSQAAAGNPVQGTITAAGPHVRIDYIFAAGPIARQIKECRPLFEGPFRTDPADKQSFALSDHLPVMARFER
jgi:endonuclease/exonuclease/phosphatase family metal-dependent hydrolase